MVRKSKFPSAVVIIVVLVILVGGIFLYNSLREKSTEESASPAGEGLREGGEGVSPSGEDTPSNDVEKTGGASSSGGGGSGGSGGGGGSSSSSSSSTNSDPVICQNAQNNQLCNGLDLTYGEGYQSACCSEHSLCC